MYKGQIPFDQHGNPLPYAQKVFRPGKPPARGVFVEDSTIVWKDNEVFRATLKFERFERGRSAAHAIYAKADDPSWQVTMFLSDLEDVIQRGEAPFLLTGRWEFVKRGQNYGVKKLLIDA